MKSSQAIYTVLLGLALTACNNNYKLDTVAADNGLSTPVGPGGPSAPPACTVSNVTQNLRILFMVDDSGSTLTTDPNYTNRVTVIQDFINKYQLKTNLSYSYNYFGTNTSTYNTSSASFGNITSSNVFGTYSDAQNALNIFKNMSGDAGSTNYSSAFTRIESIVGGDINVNPTENYVVIFMSDGQPTDQGSSASDQISGITSLSSTLMGLAASGKITLSTVYFGASDAQAENNLETMATLGGGQFINTNVTTSYSIDNLISVPVSACN